MSDRLAEACAALALTRVAELGPARIRVGIDRHGSALAALEAFRRGDFGALLDGRPSAGRGRRHARPSAALLERLRGLEPSAAAEIEAWAARGIRVVPCTARDYPVPLRELHDPPVLLYLQGRGRLPGRRAVTIVGSRAATDYGRRMARDLAAGFARYGWTVVSGMARGIDAEAHRGTLEAGGRTVGVLAGGLESGGGRLREAVRAGGLLVSEIEPSLSPDAWAFPRRNRILAALGQAVVVVQAGPRSGTSITVGHALDVGRDVFAVPGPVGPAVSEGVHRLVRSGAGLVTRAEHVLEALGESPAVAADVRDGVPGALGTLPRPRWASRAILGRIESGPADAGELIRLSGLSPSSALALLSRLELAGWLRVEGDGRYGRPGAAAAHSGASPPLGSESVATGRDGTEPPMLA